jgi:hypothetical protein
VVALRGVVATVAAIAWAAASGAVDRAFAGGPENPSLLLFSGTDLWQYGGFLYGGLLWSPGGLDTDGFTLKMLLDGGKYNYISGALQQSIDGTKLSAAVLPGWHFTRGGLSVSVFAGPVVQDYRLTPADPGSRLDGFYAGAEFAADIWYQPNALTMAALNGAINSIGPTGYVRAAFGYRLFAQAFIGPEVEQLWSADYEELELGAQLTALRIHALEWSMGTGVALTSDQRHGPYLRLGVDARY